jgi:predicted O-methyltransferase YrrM
VIRADGTVGAVADQIWSDVDTYLAGLLVGPDPALDAALEANAAAALPAIDVPAMLGKLLHLLARATGARRILEVGTLGGYSTIWLARALPPDGRVVTLEVDPRHARVARDNLALAGLDGLVDLVEGPALDTLATLTGPFDLVFVDADKPSNPAYLEHALRLTRPGSMIIVDNVVRGGRLLDADSDDPTVRGSRGLVEMLAAEPRVSATVLQTVGAKGHDGFALALVL